jgi:PAS domain S-box-containing protein
MALTSTPETLQEIGRLYTRIAQLERESGIRPPGPPDESLAAPPALAPGLHEIIADYLPDCVLFCNLAAEILHANAATERVFGWRASEMTGTNAWSYVHPEDLKAVATARSAPLDDGIPFLTRTRAPGGGWRRMEVSARKWPKEDSTHVILHVRLLEKDAAALPAPAPDEDAEKLRAQLRHAASLARLSQLALGLPLVADVLDAGTSLGATGLGLTVGAWLVPDGPDLRVTASTGLPAERADLRVPILGSLAGIAWSRQRTVDDSLAPAELLAVDPVLAATGSTRGVAVAVRGVDRVHGVLLLAGNAPAGISAGDLHFAETIGNVLATSLDSRAAQEALSRRERLARALFEHARDGLAIVDDLGRVVEANQAVHAALGLPDGALVGRRPADAGVEGLDLSAAPRRANAAQQALVRTGGEERAVEIEWSPDILPGLALANLRVVRP